MPPSSTRRRRSNPDAGAALPAPAPAPAAETTPATDTPPSPPPATARVRSGSTTRQTLDLPSDQYERLHDEVRAYARELGFTTRELNAQHVLRSLVGRMLDDAELRRAVLEDVRRRTDRARVQRRLPSSNQAGT